MQNLDTKSDNKKSIITLVNWAQYQFETNNEDSKMDNKRTTEGHRQECNNERNIIYTDIFDYWNSKGIIIHRNLDELTKRKIKTSLSNYSLDEIKTAIDNYSHIVNGKDFFFNYKWNLKEFLSRGIDKFINLEIAQNNYRNRTFNDNLKIKDNLPNNESLTNRILL
jgi:hypothetical protein